MSVLVCLSIILFLLMKSIGGEKGTRSFIALFLNFGLILLTILLMARGVSDPILLTLIACVLISCINLFYINTVNFKSLIAFISTMITLLFLVAIIFVIFEKANLGGFGIEEIEELSFFTMYVGVDFLKIAICTVIMGSIGAITDTAISISSAMNEIWLHNPNLSRSNLFKSGMNVGKDILGTTTNTLYFAFVGGYLALLLWFNDLSYSFGAMINSKVFSSEVISIFCIGTGAILVIPITAWITAYVFTRFKTELPIDKSAPE